MPPCKIVDNLGEFQNCIARRVLVLPPIGRILLIRVGNEKRGDLGVCKRITDYHPCASEMIGGRNHKYAEALTGEKLFQQFRFVRGTQRNPGKAKNVFRRDALFTEYCFADFMLARNLNAKFLKQIM